VAKRERKHNRWLYGIRRQGKVGEKKDRWQRERESRSDGCLSLGSERKMKRSRTVGKEREKAR